MASIIDLLKTMVSRNASDVHLQVGSPPIGRVDGKLIQFGTQSMLPDQTMIIAKTLLSPEQWEEFEYRHELDFAYLIPGVARFRCNIFRQRGSVGIVMRIIADTIPSFEALGLPSALLENFASQERGIILTTGPTGSGKSTTLASIIDHINRTYSYNVITIEDPIEILHKNQRSIVVQREVGSDTSDFKTALKYAMRQDPDVIMIGEMRDKETVEAALTAAQTGHLVLSTLHTQDSVRTINRIIDFFAPHEREQIRILFADSLVGILSQRLLSRADGAGRVLAVESLVATQLIRDYIKDEDKTPQIRDVLNEGNLGGMQSFDQHLVDLFMGGAISLEEARSSATSLNDFNKALLERQANGGAQNTNKNMAVASDGLTNYARSK